MKLTARCPAFLPLLVTLLPAILLLSGCSVISDISGGPHRSCSASRHGFCFDAAVSGTPISELSASSRRDLELYREDKYVDSETFWEVSVPKGTAIAVSASANSSGEAWLGSSPTVQIVLRPLNNQKLEGQMTLSANPSVRIGGQAAVTAAKTLQSNVLPRGDYIMSLTMSGEKNWDRKTVLLRVG
jgi:hypothetical protein